MKKRPLSPLLSIFLIVLVDILAMTLILPLLPFYAQNFGASPTVVGLLAASFAIFQLLSGPLLGGLSDKYGRKRILMLSQVGTFVGLVVLAKATTLWMVFAGRIIQGATAGNIAIAQAFIADVTEPKNRAKAFGIIGVSFGIGFLLGPAISGYLSQFGYDWPIWGGAGLSLLSLFTTSFLLPSDAELGRSRVGGEEIGRRLSILDFGTYAEYFRRPALAPLLTQFFLFCMSFSLFFTGFALFAERRFTYHGSPFGPKEVGYVFAFSGFLGIILQGGLVGRLVGRFGERPLVTFGFISMAIGYTILGLAHQIPVLLFAAAINSVGHALLRPSLTSLVTQHVRRNEQGTILGLTQSLNSISQIIAPLIAGPLIDHRLLLAWALIAAMTAATGLLFVRADVRGTAT